MGYTGAFVAMLGIEMGVAGLASPFILAGAVAMGAAGLALISISAGLNAFAKVEFDQKKSEELSFALAAVKMIVRKTAKIVPFNVISGRD